MNDRAQHIDAAPKLKKEYGKPRLRRIELMTEEVMGLTCKAYDEGQIARDQPYCGIATNCDDQGS